MSRRAAIRSAISGSGGFKKPFPGRTDQILKNIRQKAPKQGRGVGPLGGVNRGGRRYL